jgi:hypothetical protein
MEVVPVCTGNMNYYEKLVKKINQSMAANPKAAMVMDMGSFEILAKGSSIKSLGKKLSALNCSHQTVVFQKPSGKAAWIL